MSIQEMKIVDPGWDTMPQQLDGIFLGATRQEDGVLEYTAVNQHGDALWAVERPSVHPGFALTHDAQGRALAVLTDAPADSSPDQASVTAYDLTSGEQAWGPVTVSGTLLGPGLVFSTPSAPSGDPAETVALDPTSGRVAARAGADDPRIVGTYGNTLLLVDDAALLAQDTGDGEQLWRVPLAEHGWDGASIRAADERTIAAAQKGTGITAASGAETAPLTLLETSPSGGALLDLRDGSVARTDVIDTAVDPTTGTRVILDTEGLHAQDPSGNELWSLTVAERTSIAALGGVFLYLREGDAVRAHNVMTGAVAQVWSAEATGRIVVPQQITATGAAVLPDGGNHLLATTTAGPG